MPMRNDDRTFAPLLFRVAAVATICLALLPFGAYAAEPKPLVLSVVPRFPATVTHRDWSPFVDRLTQAIHQPVELQVFNSFTEFERHTASGKADLAFINPYQMVQLRGKLGFIPLVRDGAKQLSGSLVVRNSDPITSVRELEGAQIAFPHPNSFGASLYMRAMLEREYGVHFTPIYVSTHANVYRSVILGKVAAGGGVNITLNQEPPAVRAQLRVIYETPGVAAHPLSAHPHLSVELREQIIDAVLRMSEDAAGREILKHVTINQPVRADYAQDYQSLEGVHLERYYVDTDVNEP